MKNNFKFLFVSILATVFVWIVPITEVQAKISDNECFEKSRVLYHKYEFALKKYGRSPAAVAQQNYAAALDRKRFIEGECSNSPVAANSLEGVLNEIESARNFCIKYGVGSNCSITSLDDYYSGFPGQEISSSNQTQPNNDSPPPKKLTAAEQKRQNQQQQAEEISTKSQQLAQENQSKADAARQGKRKRHDPAAEAHNCIKINTVGSTGSLVNICNFKISYVDCRYRNSSDELKNWLTCEKQKFGFGFIDAHKEDLTFTRKAQKLYWFACKEPARPVDYSFIEGSGINGRCHDTANSD